MSRVLNPPPPWGDFARDVVLWHGTVRRYADDIRAGGVDPARGRPARDFGRGFYTTTVRKQAESWAWKQHDRLTPSERRRLGRPVVLRFRVPLDRLAQLDSLAFVLGGREEDRFWSLIHHCRASTDADIRTHRHPARTPPDDWYDVVVGPVASDNWDQRLAFTDTDQFSFHTPAAAAVLTDLIRVGDPAFRTFPVRAGRR